MNTHEGKRDEPAVGSGAPWTGIARQQLNSSSTTAKVSEDGEEYLQQLPAILAAFVVPGVKGLDRE